MSSPTYVNLTVTDTATINNLNCSINNTTDIIASNATLSNITANSITSGSSGSLYIGDSNDLIDIQGSIINIGLSGGVINLLGTTTYIDTENTQIKDALITLNNGGSNISAINSGIEIEGTSNIIVASLKLDNNLDFIIDSTNDKLTCSNITCTNISGIVSISATNANITGTLTTNILSVTGNTTLGDLSSDTIDINSTITGFTSNGVIAVTNATASTSSTTGAFKVNGGISTQNNIYASGTINAPTLTGTISTPAQTNITSVGILNGLQVTGNNLLIGSLGINLYVNNTSGKVGFGTGSTLSSSSKVEIVGGLKCDTLDITSFNPASITTTTINSTTINNTGNATIVNAIITGNINFGGITRSILTDYGQKTLNGVSSVEFIDIPNYAREIKIVYMSKSRSATSDIVFEVGTPAAYQTTGYENLFYREGFLTYETTNIPTFNTTIVSSINMYGELILTLIGVQVSGSTSRSTYNIRDSGIYSETTAKRSRDTVGIFTTPYTTTSLNEFNVTRVRMKVSTGTFNDTTGASYARLYWN